MAWFKQAPSYTPGRGGTKIDRIVIHWIVGNLAAADAVFARPGVSAHYAIENDTVHQYVHEGDTAWHAGYFPMNQRSIGIEHSASPDRPASAATINRSAKLVAELCKRHGIPCDRAHIIKHSEVVNTRCCGTIPIDSIISKARAILAVKKPATPAKKSNATIAKEVIAGKWDNGDKRVAKLKKAGYSPSAIQAEVNKILSGQSSVKRKSNAQIAVEVIQGKWGNGVTRIAKLKRAGYDPNAVQREVNKRI